MTGNDAVNVSRCPMTDSPEAYMFRFAAAFANTPLIAFASVLSEPIAA